MKQFNFLRKVFLFALLCATGSVNAQLVVHPLAFGAPATGLTNNWYANYVGLQFEVTAPAVIARSYLYTTASNTNPGPWGGVVTSPIVNVPIIMDSTDTTAGTTGSGAITYPYSMAGKIAVIWRGPASDPQYFSCKAQAAQDAGAIACVIINEYPGGGTLDMSAGGTCPGAGITIPVFMIGNLDGIAIATQYRDSCHANPGDTTDAVRMTISPWGVGASNDVGFVPAGAAGWHAYAVPSDQLPAGAALPAAYKGLDAAFIANYGSNPLHGVKLAATLNYTPTTGGSATQLHTDTIPDEVTFDNTNPATDSILTLIGNEYNFAPGTTGTGRYDLVYTVSSDSVNGNPQDTTMTRSFYASDSVFSKCAYDFVNNVPVGYSPVGPGESSPTDYVLGSMFYVAHGHDGISSLQFTLYNPSSTLGAISSGPVNLYVAKWTDGSNGQPLDSVIENGELDVVSTASYAFQPTDTSGEIFKQPMFDSNGDAGSHAWLDSNSWYFVCVEVPFSLGYTTGIDYTTTDVYPRVFSRVYATGYLENSVFLWGGDYISGTPTLVTNPSVAEFPVAFPDGPSTISVDSFNYAEQIGLVPTIAMIINHLPDTGTTDTTSHVGVNQVKAGFANISLFPNPAADYINVSATFAQTAPTVTYKILDGLLRTVRKETHYNVSSESFEMTTGDLASGDYYMVVNANGQVKNIKFAVVR